MRGITLLVFIAYCTSEVDTEPQTLILLNITALK